MNDAIRAKRERERNAFNEFADLSMAIQKLYTLDMVIRQPAGFDSVRQGRFASGLVGLYHDKLDDKWPAFLATDLFVEEDNRGLTLKSNNRAHLITVAQKFQEYAQGTGFTISL